MKRYIKSNFVDYPTITIYDSETGEEVFVYTPDMQPEISKTTDDLVVDGPFTIYYLSGFEDDDDEFTTCDYDFSYYAIVSNDVSGR